jgi:hypothetical protein
MATVESILKQEFESISVDLVKEYDKKGMRASGRTAESLEVVLTNPTSVVDDQSELPNNFQLQQNYPNPFNPSTTIAYSLAKSNLVTLKIYNLSGQKIETLANGLQTAGEHEITWQPEGLASGTYICSLQTGDYSETRKLVLQK